MGRVELSEEKERSSPHRRRSILWLLGSLVLILLFFLVAQQALGLWEILTPDTASETLLLYALSTLNFIAFIIFSFIFVRNLLKLRQERRERQLGSKIKTRLVVYFIVVSLLPITAMAVFSYIFLNRSLEKWFSRLPEDVVNEARLAQQGDVQEDSAHLREATALAALALEGAEGSSEDLARVASSGAFDGLAIVAADGNLRAKHLISPDVRLDDALGRAAAGEDLSEEFIMASAPLADGARLIAIRRNQGDDHLARIVAGAETYERLRERQRRVRLLGLSTLGLLTLLLLFASSWTALYLSRGIATPIRALAEAANEVARGNLAHRVTGIAEDELALLAESFNQMTAQLEENRRHLEANAAELREKNLALEERSNYIETVLESLSTGVISLDEDDRVTTINAAALAILLLGRGSDVVGRRLSEIVCAEDHAALARVIRRARRSGRATEQTQLIRSASGESDPVPVALTATALRPRLNERRGVVVVMEDLSDLLEAQRVAAWSEVARRMAHEIKNPLTPIQLSAERIARHFHRLADGDGSERERIARIVEEGTTTIVREVAGLKAMVDEFARFARLPRVRLETHDLNEVVRRAIALYEERLGDVRLDVQLAPHLPVALLDAEQMKRALVNLIDNALEALAEVEGERRITVATGYDPSRALLLLEVVDTGHGIAPRDFPHIFQPYFSTRGRGTGLGLAIVQRIVIEHGGRIRADANRPRGARFIIELPVTEERQTHEAQQS
ncbi:sensor histidine kinase [Pyrinomonas methylaliphatogenes]|jgi:PAS domain S-box-containing protein|uniref:histidine kinase n=1 Tax=Pyrinomonas methylaliphatogenes TaxID=454194 RepID=A0A0B6WZE4_9BACT|nr:ATP-binding protein [Pyrinomonas methylaliphatogenes]CDM65664.1 PAS domain S-box [Pyrinomonas methylaliphatogenes]